MTMIQGGRVGKRHKLVLERLAAAHDEQDLVRLERRDDFDDLEGYVVDLGERWFTFAVLDPAIVLDGHAFLRIQDLDRVRGRHNADMVRQALTHREQWPPAPPPVQVDLTDSRRLLESLSTQPVVTIHPEDDNPDVCFIGAPSGLGDRSLRLLEVTPRGVWNARPTKHRIDAITRVEIGGQYEQALSVVAGARAE